LWQNTEYWCVSGLSGAFRNHLFSFIQNYSVIKGEKLYEI
jgi:hypothetical protein